MWVPVKNQFSLRKPNLLKVCSIFSQVLKVFSRGEFEKAVKEQKVERYARGFSSCGQFLAAGSGPSSGNRSVTPLGSFLENDATPILR